MHVSKPARSNKEAKTGQIIRIEQDQLNKHLDKVVRGTVERTLNSLLDAEADRLCHAGRYERTEARKDSRAGHYTRNLETKAGTVKLKVPKLRTLTFETAIIERYRRRESSVEEALIEMYLAGISFGTFFDQENVRARPDGGKASYRSEVEIGHRMGLFTGTVRPFVNFITLMNEYNDDGSFHPASIRYTVGIGWEKPLSKHLSFFTAIKHFCWHPVDDDGTVEQANFFEIGFRF